MTNTQRIAKKERNRIVQNELALAIERTILEFKSKEFPLYKYTEKDVTKVLFERLARRIARL